MMNLAGTCAKWRTLSATLLGAICLAGCAQSSPGVLSAATPMQTHYYFARGGKPVCKEYLGRPVECSCMSRADFNRFFD